jgi:hypothetical protein
MLTWWTNFANYHNPNGEDSSDPLWPTAENFNGDDDPSILRISADPTSEPWPETEKCQFWE